LVNLASSSLAVAESYSRNSSGGRDVGVVIGGVVFGVIVLTFVIVLVVSMWADSDSYGRRWAIFWIAFIILGVIAFLSQK
jgi:Ca2+/Na+ antiporter